MSFFDKMIVASMPLVPKFIIGRVAARYVAGETLDQAVELIKRLNGEGAMATVDLLGEEVKVHAKASEAVAEYLRILERIEKEKLDANISVKPTQIGLGFDENFCRDNYDQLAKAAKERNNFMRLDMEDRTTTDATLRIYRYCHERHGNVGPVLQAYMRRTLQDIAELPENCVSVRLCKGIYVEPREAAFKAYETVRLNYLQALEALLRRGIYVGIATHDEHLVCGALGILDRLGIPRHRYEFQMLLGVDNALRKILIDGGHRLRLYVPYGRDWYPYSMRRLRENPQVAGHVARALLRGE